MQSGQRLKAQGDQERAADRHRCSEARDPFHQGAEAEPDDQQQNASVWGDVMDHPAAKQLEFA